MSVLTLSACGQSDSDTSSRGQAGTAAGDSPSAAPGGALTVPEDADPETKNHYLTENAIAACMKERGFSYTPVAEALTSPGEAASAIDGEDYALAKKYRQKYGFGLYAPAVYPNDPALASAEVKPDPNDAYLDSLPAAQQKAYKKALGQLEGIDDSAAPPRPPKDGCVAQAELKVEGPPKSKAEQERENARQTERDKQAGQALNGDPQLVSLAQEYAACLRKKGITVTTTQPTGIGDMVKFQVGAQVLSEPSKEEALPKLAREIDLALKDLECGKQFRAAYWPKYKKNPYVGDNG
ncbi:hypothetical protein BU52_22910 [Streptomyces toyocaensis]|uniref:Uncharacterized protein n=1 Tax=Streptomyces toyocaensis TaxID=55952 RepID=A0A081XMX1_STRTO|nr:hypothetical protein [Streptomyces toyocaensis]KES04894.1 hypothetical protein BU52_22910 [Streptomyces toyocaensis]